MFSLGTAPKRTARHARLPDEYLHCIFWPLIYETTWVIQMRPFILALQAPKHEWKIVSNFIQFKLIFEFHPRRCLRCRGTNMPLILREVWALMSRELAFQNAFVSNWRNYEQLRLSKFRAHSPIGVLPVSMSNGSSKCHRRGRAVKRIAFSGRAMIDKVISFYWVRQGRRERRQRHDEFLMMAAWELFSGCFVVCFGGIRQ